MIRVGVVGAAGRMGTETLHAIESCDDFILTLAVDHGENVSSPIAGLSITSFLPEPIEDCDVLVEFTHADSATEHSIRAAENGVSPVIGASGLSPIQQQQVSDACALSGVGGILVPNFAIGAVLMMRFASEAAKWMPDAEVIEMHHDKKQDAPSGTGIHTAELISAARSGAGEDPTRVVKFEGARGATVDGVHVHSIRLPGLVAHQQIMFGGPGEVLSIRHDSMHRSSFMEGVKLAVRKVRDLDGLVVGLDQLM